MISDKSNEPVTDDITSLSTSSTRLRSRIRRSASLVFVMSQQVINISPASSCTGMNSRYFGAPSLPLTFLTYCLTANGSTDLRSFDHFGTAWRRAAGSGYT